MTVFPHDDMWIFVIKTNKYAGNFERQMCAYCTGVLGECGVGGKEREIFLREAGENDEKFSKSVLLLPHCDGCNRPCSIWGPDYKDVAIFFHERPTDEMIGLMISRAHEYTTTWCPQAEFEWNRHEIEILGLELHKEEVKTTLEKSWP